MPTGKPFHMSPEEKRLARELHFEKGKRPVEVADLLGRDLSCVVRLLAQKKAPNRVGRPPLLTEGQVDRLVQVADALVDKAEATWEVSAEMIRKRARVKASIRTVYEALHKRGFRFRDLRAKLLLTPADVAERFAWAKAYRHKSRAWWLKTIHMHWDNHVFKVPVTQKGRQFLAARRIRGVWRRRGLSLRKGTVKPNPRMRQYTGAKGIQIACGVGSGKVLMWQQNDTWSGKVAEELYQDVMHPALRGEHPSKRAFNVLEDNDPTGNCSKLARAKKAALHINVFSIPKRSPELNVLDYAIWSEIEKRMRQQERNWNNGRKETRDQYARRLRATAARLSKKFIDNSIANLQIRCKRLYEAKGGLFEEGGRPRASRRPL